MIDRPAAGSPHLASHISSSEAIAAATSFLLDHVGNHLIAGQAHLMVSAVRAVWIVPVELTYIHTGSLGSVGVVAVDQETGQVIAWTPFSEMKAASRNLRAEREPEITKSFQSFMTSTAQAPRE